MTEDEAKTKWCPFSRVVEQGKAVAAHNRVQQSRGLGTEVPRASFCIGSACMAWREQHRVLTGWAIRADDQEPLYSAAPSGGGFCGLAGAAQ